jgi:LAO/AO transport system kinase
VRMRDLSGDAGVFIRSMATRGTLGGIASAAANAVRVLDAAGFTYVIVETVGAGQSEVAIASLAHTCLVVEAPGLGDDVQAIKAGILEIADVLVVNKADRPGAQHTVRALRMMLELGHPTRDEIAHHGLQGVPVAQTAPHDESLWIPPIVETVATDGTGMAALAESIAAHREYLSRTNRLASREYARLRAELELIVRDHLWAHFAQQVSESAIHAQLAHVQRREIPLSAAAHALLAQLRL